MGEVGGKIAPLGIGEQCLSHNALLGEPANSILALNKVVLAESGRIDRSESETVN